MVEAHAFDRLLQHLERGIGDGRGPAVGRVADEGGVAVEVVLDGRAVGVHAADGHDAFGLAVRDARVDREGTADGDVEHLRIVVHRLRRLGHPEGSRRVGERNETVGTGVLRLAHDRGEVRRAQRIGLVIDQFEPGLFEGGARAVDEVDPEAVGDRNDRDLVVDLARIARRGQHFDETRGVVVPAAQHPEAPVPAFREFRRLVGHRRDGKLRVAEPGHQRRDRKVGAGAPGRQDQVDLVLRCQPFDGTHQVFVGGPVVVFDDLDHLAGPVGHFEPAGLVYRLNPQLVVGDRRDPCAGCIRAGPCHCIADGHGVVLGHGHSGRQCCHGRNAHGQRAQGCAPRYTNHEFLPFDRPSAGHGFDPDQPSDAVRRDRISS